MCSSPIILPLDQGTTLEKAVYVDVVRIRLQLEPKCPSRGAVLVMKDPFNGPMKLRGDVTLGKPTNIKIPPVPTHIGYLLDGCYH